MLANDFIILHLQYVHWGYVNCEQIDRFSRSLLRLVIQWRIF